MRRSLKISRNSLIVWRSLEGSDIQNLLVRFERAAGGGTVVRVEMQYAPPAGVVGTIAKLFGKSPGSSLTKICAASSRLWRSAK